MGLISRVSSRTYRASKMPTRWSDRKKFFLKINSFSLRVFTRQKFFNFFLFLKSDPPFSTRPCSPYLQKPPSSALKAKQDGMQFKELARKQAISSSTAAKSHYSSNALNMQKVKPKAKMRVLGPEADLLELNEQILELKKNIKLQEKSIKKHQATIRRLEKINAEKDKILDEEDGNVQPDVRRYGGSLDNPVALRK